jgi:response regulator RpfG family c-di-GMP phosphodiesterase
MNSPIQSNEDDLVFLDEPDASEASADSAAQGSWRIMIIDDDPDVHSATTFALGSLEIQHRPLSFLHAYSAAEAREILQKEKDIAIILLDVVMEHEDAVCNWSITSVKRWDWPMYASFCVQDNRICTGNRCDP